MKADMAQYYIGIILGTSSVSGKGALLNIGNEVQNDNTAPIHSSLAYSTRAHLNSSKS